MRRILLVFSTLLVSFVTLSCFSQESPRTDTLPVKQADTIIRAVDSVLRIKNQIPVTM